GHPLHSHRRYHGGEYEVLPQPSGRPGRRRLLDRATRRGPRPGLGPHRRQRPPCLRDRRAGRGMTGDVTLGLRPAGECPWDAVCRGEVMLRVDPGERRIRTARRFSAWEGGGEYNVTRGLRRCVGQRTAVVTALVENELGRLVEDLILTGGVDTSLIKWVPDD